ncbi:MAG TPA: hypothetical protein VLA13_04055 [Massilibacterium sp.]|nr:hypothetical protein [Massilibacterium sp.]
MTVLELKNKLNVDNFFEYDGELFDILDVSNNCVVLYNLETGKTSRYHLLELYNNLGLI